MMTKAWPRYFSEFLGTFLLVLFGCGSIVLNEIYGSFSGSLIPIVFGLTITLSIYLLGPISGAHFNPAVTIAFALTKNLAKKEIPGYILAQFLGAFLASIVHLGLWGQQHSFGVTQIAIALPMGIGIEVIISFILMFVIIAVATTQHPIQRHAAVPIGATVAICAFVAGPATGASMNPARSLGPALLSGQLQHLWVYLFFTVVGASMGAWVYEKIRRS